MLKDYDVRAAHSKGIYTMWQWQRRPTESKYRPSGSSRSNMPVPLDFGEGKQFKPDCEGKENRPAVVPASSTKTK